MKAEEIKALREATEAINKSFPWLSATPEQVRIIAVRAEFPRSIAGARQDDQLLRRIYFCTRQCCEDSNIARLKIVEAAIAESKYEEITVSKLAFNKETEERVTGEQGGNYVLEFLYMAREFCRLLNLGEPFRPKADSEFFSRVAECLNYLETYKPSLGDYAVEALQNAFVGLMQSKYDWGKKAVPTKGEVREMAKAHLEEQGTSKKSGWTNLLREAGLDWLPAGQAGRPSKVDIDENVKAGREYRALCTQAVNDFYGGDIIRARDSLKAAYGGKSEYQRSERDRLASSSEHDPENGALE